MLRLEKLGGGWGNEAGKKKEELDIAEEKKLSTTELTFECLQILTKSPK